MTGSESEMIFSVLLFNPATEYTAREDVQAQAERLKECISVLFVFHRKPTRDTEFVENIRRWTERLVSGHTVVHFCMSEKCTSFYTS